MRYTYIKILSKEIMYERCNVAYVARGCSKTERKAVVKVVGCT